MIEYRTNPNGIVVSKVETYCDLYIFKAWEPSSYTGRHFAVTSIDGKCYGMIGTDPDHSAFDHIAAGSLERIDAVNAEYARRREVAYAEIIAAFPEAATGRRTMNEIELRK